MRRNNPCDIYIYIITCKEDYKPLLYVYERICDCLSIFVRTHKTGSLNTHAICCAYFSSFWLLCGVDAGQLYCNKVEVLSTHLFLFLFYLYVSVFFFTSYLFVFSFPSSFLLRCGRVGGKEVRMGGMACGLMMIIIMCSADKQQQATRLLHALTLLLNHNPVTQ